jgi:hypothetical protein
MKNTKRTHYVIENKQTRRKSEPSPNPARTQLQPNRTQNDPNRTQRNRNPGTQPLAQVSEQTAKALTALKAFQQERVVT